MVKRMNDYIRRSPSSDSPSCLLTRVTNMTTLLSSARSSRQNHSGIAFGKPSKAKRLRFVDQSAPFAEPVFKELTTANIRAISRGLPEFEPVSTVIRLINGERLTVRWVNGSNPDRIFTVSLV